METTIGGKSVFEQADVLLFMETWEAQGNGLPTIGGFECIGSIFNAKVGGKGRGYGGIAAYVRIHLQSMASIEHKDSNNQFLVLKLQTKGTPSFIFATYFAPLNMPIYKRGIVDASNPFASLSESVHALKSQGDVWLVGDFNARILNEQFSSLEELGAPTWSSKEVLDTKWLRSSLDEKTNQMAPYFLQFGATCGLRIVNGISRFPLSSDFTFVSQQGCSTIDYLLATVESASKLVEFKILELQPESCHRPLVFHLHLFVPYRSRQAKKSQGQRLILDSSKMDLFRLEVESLLSTKSNMLDLVEVVAKASTRVFSTRLCSKHKQGKEWYDKECIEARKKAIAQEGDHKLLALRRYSTLTKQKKRRFLRQHQQVLCKEFEECPQLFWKRLQARKGGSCLAQDALVSYVESLYYFPDAQAMPLEVGDAIQFSEKEISSQLSRMQNGKAIDIHGLSLELLQWGGSRLLSSLTSGLNQALVQAIPKDWMTRRLVPIHKEGDKEEASNYRTIMVASIFAKVLGGLLESNLSKWAEAHKKRALSQAGFRAHYNTLDHVLCLRVLGEQAKRLHKPLYCCFVDFSKAFDKVSRYKLWERMVALGVPLELRVAIAKLYEKVIIRFSSTNEVEVLSTLGVIQGCPLSPTLFGLFIDQLHEVLATVGGKGAQLGNMSLQLLIFADDVVLVAEDPQALQQHLVALEEFCSFSGMKVNLKKTQCFAVGTRQAPYLLFEGEKIEVVDSYKYLGVNMSSNWSWATCVKVRVANGFKAFYSMINKCKLAGLATWKLKKKLFVSLVRPVLLYGVQVWGPGTSKSNWPKIEAIQKLFLEMELGVKSQTPYTLTLAEVGLLPLEVEALFITLRYVMYIRKLDDSRLPKQAYYLSCATGWYADVIRWAQAWGLQEHEWRGDSKALRKILEARAIKHLWSDPSPRLQYYKRDANAMQAYGEQEYLRASISLKVRQSIARYRLSSHHLAVEEGRWKQIERKDRICTICNCGSIENEYHVFIACRAYHHIRVEHQILVNDLHDLFKMPPKQLGYFILAIDRRRSEILAIDSQSPLV